jgi:predicted nucleic acid-binding protein
LILSEIVDNAEVFIDSNIFIYHFSRFEKFADACFHFFQRIEEGSISGYTSDLVLAEVLHWLMIIEPSEKFGFLPKEVTKYLKANPDKIASLTDPLDSISYIDKLGISILTVSLKDIKFSSEFERKFMLFTNDAINLAIMKNNNIAHLASNDSDFEKVDFLTLYKPQ